MTFSSSSSVTIYVIIIIHWRHYHLYCYHDPDPLTLLTPPKPANHSSFMRKKHTFLDLQDDTADLLYDNLQNITRHVHVTERKNNSIEDHAWKCNKYEAKKK